MPLGFQIFFEGGDGDGMTSSLTAGALKVFYAKAVKERRNRSSARGL